MLSGILLSLAGAATSIIFVTTKVLSQQIHLCLLSRQNTSFVVTKVCLSRQNFCLNKIMFVTTKHLLGQTCVCHNKTFVMTTILLLQQKMCFVMTYTCLLQQKYACCDKTFVATKLCLSWQKFFVTKYYVVTSILLLRQKTCFVSRQTYVCHNKTFARQKWYLWQLPPLIYCSVHIQWWWSVRW